MSARPVPYVLVHVREPVGGERAARDFVAVPLTPEAIERIGKQSLTWLRISMESRASAMKFELPEVHRYEGHDPDRGWMPAEFAGDPSWEEEFDVEVEIPAVVRRVVEEEVLAFADESALDVMDSRVETRAELLFEFDEMRIEVGPGRDGVRLQSHELPAGVLVWGALYWGLAERPEELFRVARQCRSEDGT